MAHYRNINWRWLGTKARTKERSERRNVWLVHISSKCSHQRLLGDLKWARLHRYRFSAFSLFSLSSLTYYSHTYHFRVALCSIGQLVFVPFYPAFHLLVSWVSFLSSSVGIASTNVLMCFSLIAVSRFMLCSIRITKSHIFFTFITAFGNIAVNKLYLVDSDNSHVATSPTPNCKCCSAIVLSQTFWTATHSETMRTRGHFSSKHWYIRNGLVSWIALMVKKGY